MYKDSIEFPYRWNSCAVNKFLCVMKLTIIVLIATCLHVSASSYAQQISLNVKNTSLQNVFKDLRKQSGYNFLYDSDMLNETTPVTLSVKNVPLKEVLDACFRDQPVTYVFLDKKTIIIRERQTSSPTDKNEIVITGRVTDRKGQPLPGVTVKVKGTSTGAVTNANGTYSIKVLENNAILVFTSLGYAAKEFSINGQKNIDVVLEEQNQSLNDVVVVGYGTQKKVNVTGSVATASSADIENRPFTSGSQVLNGLVTGVQIQQGGGRPGGDAAGITIRGIGTFGAGSAPLILQDGLAVSSLDDIDPDNIKSVSILKDASAAAIYGSRAANGVVLVETKRGQSGKMAVNYNNYFGWQNATDLPTFVSSATYAKLTGQSDATVAKYQSGADPDNFPNVYHLKNLLNSGNGFQTDHNLSFSGGDLKSTYLFSTTYRNQNGITAETNAKTYNFLLNIDSKLKDNLLLKVNLSGFSKNNTQPIGAGGGINGIIGYAAREPNTYAGLKSDGTFGHQDAFSPEGWLASPSFSKFSSKNFLGSVSLSWTIVQGLSLSGQAGYRYYNNQSQSFYPTVQFDANTYIGPNNLNQSNADGSIVTLNSILKYARSYKKHNFSILAGYQQENEANQGFSASRDNFPNNLLYQLDVGASTNQQNGGSRSQNALQSYFGRFNYDFAGKYLVEASFRNDGSSRFPSSNRFAFFPSVSVGWRVSEESFIKDNFTWIDQLKFRASTGSLGNQAVPNYPYQNLISLGQNYTFGGVSAPGAALTNLSNINIKWETTTTSDIGLDFDLFKGKLSGTVELYNKTTTGILYTVPASATLGLNPPVSNAGSMRNTGFEANLKYSDHIGQVNFSIAPNFSYAKSIVTKIAGDLQQNIGARLFVGQPLNTIYGYVADGIFTNAADVAGYPTQPIAGKPGVIRFKDLNGDGKVDATNDQKVIANTNPKYSFGLTLNASYKGFDASALFQGLAGFSRQISYYNTFAYYNGGNIQQWQVDNAWTPDNPNPNAKYPQITNLSQGSENVQSSTFFIRDASFVRLKNAQIGYSFTNSVLQKLHIARLRLFVGGQNLYTWKKFFPGFDPEVPQAYNDGPSYYPLTKLYTFGLNLKF